MLWNMTAENEQKSKATNAKKSIKTDETLPTGLFGCEWLEIRSEALNVIFFLFLSMHSLR